MCSLLNIGGKQKPRFNSKPDYTESAENGTAFEAFKSLDGGTNRAESHCDHEDALPVHEDRQGIEVPCDVSP